MRFEWDEDKNNSNIQKHGLDFVDVKEVFDGPMAISSMIVRIMGKTGGSVSAR